MCVTVMLMSLKAGNLGLNMVAACQVILLDLWWNPTTEDQAIDRAHRIGQTRPVIVSRLTIKNTVEDRILALQVTVMLMSLKAGNLGLNMVAACQVILLDLWWNPTTEDQAIDRAHRIGQTRPVIVSRLTIKNTVEDRILALQFGVVCCSSSDKRFSRKRAKEIAANILHGRYALTSLQISGFSPSTKVPTYCCSDESLA
ncbi:unnamed protein product [Ilex paraguariensis]|uniref:Helicase C-terminal domain-containing protein n=1 Tax=Ilex paraguariensis TaxID=185542 RepID=A0ABC8R6C5_9AQUA